MLRKSWWRSTWKHILITTLILAAVLVVTGLILGGYAVSWTGFGAYPVNQQYNREKTLWDWMDLLIVPLVIAVGAWLLNRSGKENEQRLESDRQRQSTLEAYFDCMTELLLKEHLRTSKPSDEVRSIARTRTLAVLRILDEDRKGQALQFLFESGLISKNPIIPLTGASLHGARLENASLIGAEIRGAYLVEAQLKDANLANADLRGSDFGGADLTDVILANADLTMTLLQRAKLKTADLRGANLTWADLTNADLEGAKVSDEQLITTLSMENSVMPDGKKYGKLVDKGL
jgi:hypothetical protein